MNSFPNPAIVATVVATVALVWYASLFCLLARKSGYRTWYGLLVLVPLVNLVGGQFYSGSAWRRMTVLETWRSFLTSSDVYAMLQYAYQQKKPWCAGQPQSTVQCHRVRVRCTWWGRLSW
jgi:hypothetical protein